MNIAVKGVGITKFGELWEKNLEDLIVEAGNQALTDAGNLKIEAIFVGNMLYGKLSGQNHLGSLTAQLLNLKVPGFFTEAACASGGVAVNLAIQSIEAGRFKNVLVIGAEKMTDHPAPEIARALMGAGSLQETKSCLTFPGLYALMAKAHLTKYGTTRKQLAEVAVKNHFHGSLNPNAHFRNQITVEKVINSPKIAEPLTLLDCSPISDGAAAVVLSSGVAENDVKIIASQLAVDTLDLADRTDLTTISATVEAGKLAFKQAGVEIKEIDLAEVHDCFTIAEILALEDLGFCKKGVKYRGKVAVNTSGGLKACGHPVGATGVKQIVEITTQLRGQAGKRQVKNAKLGLTQNVGGTGGTVVVHILQK